MEGRDDRTRVVNGERVKRQPLSDDTTDAVDALRSLGALSARRPEAGTFLLRLMQVETIFPA